MNIEGEFMQNIINEESINNIFEFYTLANALKENTITYYIENLKQEQTFTLADSIFGSMIIAIGANLEYNESKDLGKILRMILLKGFYEVNPDYDFSKLKLGFKYKEELEEVLLGESEEAKLVRKYEQLYTRYTLLSNGAEVDKVTELLKLNGYNFIQDYEISPLRRFIYCSLKLRHVDSCLWDTEHWNTKKDTVEKVSEHVVSSMLLAMLISSELEINFDLDETLTLLLLHEESKSLYLNYSKFDVDYTKLADSVNKHERENIFGGYSIKTPLKRKEELLELLTHFDNSDTIEGYIANLCDQLDDSLQLKLYQEQNLYHQIDEQSDNKILKNPLVENIIKNGISTPYEIWYELNKDGNLLGLLLEYLKDYKLIEEKVLSK
jgi:hypothetical protein